MSIDRSLSVTPPPIPGAGPTPSKKAPALSVDRLLAKLKDRRAAGGSSAKTRRNLTALVAAGEAQKLPPLLTPIKGLRCFTTYTFERERALLVPKYFQPLTDPRPSARKLLAPLRDFTEQLPSMDPEFTFFIFPKGEITTRGTCDASKKEIHLYDEESLLLPSTTLIHELSHLAVDKLGLEEDGELSFRKRVLEAASKDVAVLSGKGWKTARGIVADKLSHVATAYKEDKHWEEYLVRVPQIISEFSSSYRTKSQTRIEARIKKEIPHLFEIYKSEFLPRLEAYVAKEREKSTSKIKVAETSSTFEEAAKDKRVVGLIHSFSEEEQTKPTSSV